MSKLQNIKAIQKLLSGTMSIAETDTAVIGLGTKFTTELIVGDTIAFTDNTGESLTGVVAAIISNTSLTLATATLSLDVTTSSPIVGCLFSLRCFSVSMLGEIPPNVTA